MILLLSTLSFAADIQVGKKSLNDTVQGAQSGDRLILPPKPIGLHRLNGQFHLR